MSSGFNDITGDKIKSKVNSDKFRDNWDKVFGKKDSLYEELKESLEEAIEIQEGRDV